MIRAFSLFLALLAMSGCSSPPPPPGVELDPYLAPARGRVVRVNPVDRHVILECPYLPRAGEEITLYRQGEVVAKVRVGTSGGDSLYSAEIVEGNPRTGDWFRGPAVRANTPPATEPR